MQVKKTVKILFFITFIFCASGAAFSQKLDLQEMDAITKKVEDTPVLEAQKGELYIFKTSMGDFTAELFIKAAPRHAANFKRLVISEFYDKTLFHRIVKGYIIQGGDLLSRDRDPDNDGTGNPGYTLKQEFNNISHKKGIISMARGRDPDSAGSQFFIMLGDAPELDQKYTVFGRVVNGFDVLDKIGSAPVGYSSFKEKSRPLEPIILYKVIFVAPPLVKLMNQIKYRIKNDSEEIGQKVIKRAIDKVEKPPKAPESP